MSARPRWISERSAATQADDGGWEPWGANHNKRARTRDCATNCFEPARLLPITQVVVVALQAVAHFDVVVFEHHRVPARRVGEARLRVAVSSAGL